MNADSSVGGGRTAFAAPRPRPPKPVAPRQPVAPYRLYGGGRPAAPPPASIPTAPPDPPPVPAPPRRPVGEAGDGWGRAAAYDAHADGLHTYAILSLRDHDAAVDALYTSFVIADRNVTQLRQPEQIHPWLYAILRYECRTRLAASSDSGPAPTPISRRLRSASGPADPDGSLASLERSLRQAEFRSLEWPEAEGLAPAHREILELTIRHGLDSRGLGLALGLNQPGRSRIFDDDPSPDDHLGDPAGTPAGDRRTGDANPGPTGSADYGGSVGARGFGLLADAWRELERSLAAVAVAKGPREHCAQLAELTFGWSGRLTPALRAPLANHVDGCTRCQHYLHSEVGTPAAPTILPFVAAPRTLRAILLDELADPGLARRAGVDHAALAARIGRFTADGFPDLTGTSPTRRHGSRRAASRPTRSDATSADTLSDTARPTSAPSVYRSPGSWAERVLPPVAPRTSSSPADRTPGFVATASGRFAARSPQPPHEREPATAPTRTRTVESPRARAATTSAAPETAAMTAVTPLTPVTPVTPITPVTTSGAPEPTTPTPSARSGRTGVDSRHRSRRVRRVMVSALALGTVGAAAAASAALLGLASDSPANQALGSYPASTTSGGATRPFTIPTMTGAVGTGAVGKHRNPGSARSVDPRSGRTAGNPGAGTSPTGTGASAVNTSASAGSGPASGNFHVSVNQRAANPDSVTILLRNSGATPITWTATAADAWIALSQSSGTLAGGQELDITATATSAAPAGQWTSRVSFQPGGQVIQLTGTSTPQPTGPASPGGSPTATASASAPATGPTTPAPTGPSASATPAPSTTATVTATPDAASSASASASRSAAPTPTGSSGH